MYVHVHVQGHADVQVSLGVGADLLSGVVHLWWSNKVTQQMALVVLYCMCIYMYIVHMDVCMCKYVYHVFLESLRG